MGLVSHIPKNTSAQIVRNGSAQGVRSAWVSRDACVKAVRSQVLHLKDGHGDQDFVLNIMVWTLHGSVSGLEVGVAAGLLDVGLAMPQVRIVDSVAWRSGSSGQCPRSRLLTTTSIVGAISKQ